MADAVHYASWTSSPATLVMWFLLRSPELAEDFERLMAGDRDVVRGSLDTVSDWRLTRPADVPGQAIDSADYVLIAEIVAVERWEQQASELVERLADDFGSLASSSRGMLVVRPRATPCTRAFAKLDTASRNRLGQGPPSTSTRGRSRLRRWSASVVPAQKP